MGKSEDINLSNREEVTEVSGHTAASCLPRRNIL